MIHIDDDPWEIGKNFPDDCGLQGDIRTVLAELNARIEKEVTPPRSEAASLLQERGRGRAGGRRIAAPERSPR